ncbi:MAG: FG-GAP repeat protein [Bacteroidetes bacterium]|nr:FG-GAP repeat protein [Bacteroidota bacterium]
MSVGSWLEVAKLIVSDSAGNDHFGWPVALSGDRAAVGVGIDNDVSYMFARQ